MFIFKKGFVFIYFFFLNVWYGYPCSLLASLYMKSFTFGLSKFLNSKTNG